MTEPERPFDLVAALRDELAAARTAFDDPDTERAVHQGRVRLKRIRALARLAAATAREPARALNVAARGAMAGLSDARDLAALEAAARTCDLTAVAAALSRHRTRLGVPPLEEARAKLADVEAAIAQMPTLSADDLEAGVRRLARRARRACAAARGAREADDRHTWRKREKDRSHALDVLREAWPKSVRRRRRTGKRLARALGAERDVLLLMERLRSDPKLARVATPEALAVLDARRRFLADKADRIGRVLHRDGA